MRDFFVLLSVLFAFLWGCSLPFFIPLLTFIVGLSFLLLPIHSLYLVLFFSFEIWSLDNLRSSLGVSICDVRATIFFALRFGSPVALSNESIALVCCHYNELFISESTSTILVFKVFLLLVGDISNIFVVLDCIVGLEKKVTRAAN